MKIPSPEVRDRAKALKVTKQKLSVGGILRNARTLLQDDCAFRIIGRFRADVFDRFFPIVSEVVKAQAVLFSIHQVDQIVFQLQELAVIQIGFKDGVLHALRMILAFFRDVAKPLFSGGIGG